MDGRTFAKMCKECKLLGKTFNATDCDLLFTKVKQTSGVKGKALNFQHFQACVEGISSKKGMSPEDVAGAIIASGGPSFAGATRPDAVRFHDDKSTYTGIYLNGGPSTTGDGPMELHNLLDRSPADVRGVKYDSLRKSNSNAQLIRSNSKRSNGTTGSAKHLLPDEYREKDGPTHRLPPTQPMSNSSNSGQRTTSSRNLIMQVLPKSKSGKLPPAGPPRSQSSKKLLVKTQSAMRLMRAGSKKDMLLKPGASMRRFDSFGGPKRDELASNEPPSPELQEVYNKSAGREGMDGRTFGKVMADAKVGGKKNIATDADLAFTYVKSQGKNKITAAQFEAGVRHLTSRLGLQFEDVKSRIVGAGGPQYTGTKADAVRFHDDKSTYTGIYLNGGPSTTGDGPMELHSLLDRSPADVRGVKLQG